MSLTELTYEKFERLAEEFNNAVMEASRKSIPPGFWFGSRNIEVILCKHLGIPRNTPNIRREWLLEKIEEDLKKQYACPNDYDPIFLGS